MIMETTKLIINAVFFIINSFAMCFVCIMVSKWHRRMEDKLDEIRGYIRRVSDRNDVVYIAQLQWLKIKLIEEERYEEANEINKCINIEMNRLMQKSKNKD